MPPACGLNSGWKNRTETESVSDGLQPAGISVRPSENVIRVFLVLLLLFLPVLGSVKRMWRYPVVLIVEIP